MKNAVPMIARARSAHNIRFDRWGLAGVAAACIFAACGNARAQGSWQQSQFVIGTGGDPPISATDPSLTARYFDLAQRAYFNTLTGTPRGVPDAFLSSYLNPDFSADPPITLAFIDAARARGLQLLFGDLHWSIAGGTTTVPCWDPVGCTSGSVLAEGSWTPALAAYQGYSADQEHAIVGYNLGDEPENHFALAGDLSQFLTGWTRRMHLDDIAHSEREPRAVYINLHGGIPNETPGFPDYRAYVDLYANDPDPLKRVDVLSATMYPFTHHDLTHANGFLTAYYLHLKTLREAMGTRPFWVYCQATEHVDQNHYDHVLTEEQLRFQAFAAVSAGAKGILWFTYSDMGFNKSRFDAAANLGIIPTCKYETIRTINHYLRDVAGPAVMNSTCLGQYHASYQPDTDAPADLVPSSQTPACPVSSITNPNLAVGVFRPNGASSDYVLCVFNKSRTAESGTFQLYESWQVEAAPSVVGYTGGSSYAPWGSLSAIPVSLAGGEGRFFRLSSVASPGLRLTEPLGGETWFAGAHTVRWTPASEGPVTIKFFTNPLGDHSQLDGPSHLLQSGATGGVATVSLPNLATRRGRIEISRVTAMGDTITATHAVPIATVPVGGDCSITSPEAPGSAHCNVMAEMDSDPDGAFHTVAYRNPGAAYLSSWDGSTWSQTSIGTFFSPTLNPHLRVDASSGKRHVVMTSAGPPSEEQARVREGGLSGTLLGSLVYRRFGAGGAELTTWLKTDVADDTPTALAVGPTGSAFVVYEISPGILFVRQQPDVPMYAPTITADPREFSVEVDAGNNVWVAVVDQSTSPEHLKVYRIPANQSTKTLSLDVTGPIGPHAMTTVGTTARIVYSLRNAQTGADALKYQRYNGSAWTAPANVDPLASRISGLALRYRGTTTYAAYASNGVLQLATSSGSTWQVDREYSAGDSDGPVSLGFDAEGNPSIGYFNRDADRFEITGNCQSLPPCSSCENMQMAIGLPQNRLVRIGDALSISFALPRSAEVSMDLFDVRGRRAATRGREWMSAGNRTVNWAPTSIGSGVYFLRVRVHGEQSSTAKLVMVR